MAEIVQVRRGLEQLLWTEQAPEHANVLGTEAPVSEPVAPATAVDPVCGMTVEIASARGSTDYNGTTYYFCCPGCLGRFQKNPERFLSGAGVGD